MTTLMSSGMSRDLDEDTYYNSANANDRLPLRWCAPEAAKKRKFGESSDVWAFGVTRWEMFSHALVPYTGMTNAAVLEKLLDGYTMPTPALYPQALWDAVIVPCFKFDSSDRPTFVDLAAIMATRTFMAVKEATDAGMRCSLATFDDGPEESEHCYADLFGSAESGRAPAPEFAFAADASNEPPGGSSGDATSEEAKQRSPSPASLRLDAATSLSSPIMNAETGLERHFWPQLCSKQTMATDRSSTRWRRSGTATPSASTLAPNGAPRATSLHLI